ncbi:MAG: GH25 family lysozyme [Geitlerinemataceae cyanobacterium]
MDLRGIDVSDYQGQVNWKAVADSGVGYAIAKSTEGATFIADTFARNWREIRAAGIVRGAYHFYRPQTDAVAQAQNFLNVVKLEPGDLPAVLDIERTDNMSADSIFAGMQTWLDIVEEATQRRPIVYTYPGFWERLGNSQRFADYPLWIAHYTSDPEPWVTGGWDAWTLWQYTDRGNINGVVGGVDVNRYNLPKTGKRGSDVNLIQRRLKERGIDPGVIDGIFGQNTKTAVEIFQRRASLTISGEVDPRTWAYLLDASTDVSGDVSGDGTTPSDDLPIFTPILDEPVKDIAPAPETPVVSVPEAAGAISLIDVTKYYQNLSHQVQALDWLQEQVPAATLLEFARRWRNVPSTSDPIRLVNVARYYQGLASQNQALIWLQAQLPSTTIATFAERWRDVAPTVSPALKLVDAAKYYQGMPQQQQAFAWLQQQLSATQVAEFARLWRNQ